MLSSQLPLVVLVACEMLGRTQPRGRWKRIRKEASASTGGVLGGRLEQPGKAREGRGDTAFLGGKRRRGLGHAVGLSGSHVLVEGELAGQ